MENQTDRAGVIFPPPALALAALIAALGLEHLWPLPAGPRAISMAFGICLCLFGIGIAGWGRLTLARAGTNVNPYKPTTAIVSGGPFRFTRNPLYIGLQSLLVGITLLVGTLWGLIALIPLFIVLRQGVVLREEAYLERKFGDAYLAYKSSVRRWL